MNTVHRKFRSDFTGLLAIFFIALAGAACSPLAPAAPTANATDQAVAMKQTENAIRDTFNQTATAEKKAFVQQLTQGAASTQTAMVTPTFTATVTSTPKPTATPNLLPTQQYEAMLAKVQQYFKVWIPTPPWMALIPAWTTTKPAWRKSCISRASPQDIHRPILPSNPTWPWDNASEISNWFASGCGFIFHHNPDTEEDYLVYLSLDGYGNLQGMVQRPEPGYGRCLLRRSENPGRESSYRPDGERNQYAFFVNGKLVKKYTGYSRRTFGR